MEVKMKQTVTTLDRVMEYLGFRETGSCKNEYKRKVYFPVSKFYSEELV